MFDRPVEICAYKLVTLHKFSVAANMGVHSNSEASFLDADRNKRSSHLISRAIL